jgi:hypothetical protein
MSNRKIAGEQDAIAGWTEKEVSDLELAFLHKMFDCREPEGVDVTMTYARFMSKVELDPDNYPIFLKLLQFENHWVVDALIGSKDPLVFFSRVQPNAFIVSECFKRLKRWKPGGIYYKSLLVIFGILKVTYDNPQPGYKIYSVTIPDVNNLGKHLDKSKDQSDPVNRALLGILDKIAALHDPGGKAAETKEIMDVATQANNIRGKFLDTSKGLQEAIPDELLKRQELKKTEIAPSVSYAGSGTTAKK